MTGTTTSTTKRMPAAFLGHGIPVVQLAIDARKDFDFHFELGARLAPLRERGALILGSGNVVHNLRAIDWSKPELGFDWARRFDEAARTVMKERPSDAPALRDHADFRQAAPTPDHFIPLLHLAGLASASKQVAQVPIDGYALGSLSMTSFTLEAKCPTDAADRRPGAKWPDPAVVPAEDTNA
jgi:4,5-DOPA dioxygenase extradiol